VNYQTQITPVNDLDSLGATVRAGLAAAAHAIGDVFVHAFAIGEALIEAKRLAGHSHWLRWLTECGGLSARSATVYMRIAAHRDVIETQISSSAADLTIRGALRLIGTGRTRRKSPRTSSPLSVAAWKNASLEQRTVFVASIPLPEWFAAMPASWRTEIIKRVDGLRGDATATINATAVH
jgi:hypothetical protein